MNAERLREEYAIVRVRGYVRRGRYWVSAHYRGLPGLPLTESAPGGARC